VAFFRSILSALLISAVAAPSPRVAVAIVRPDGYIVPFAAYDGQRWTRAWPEANEAPDGILSVESIRSIWRENGEPVPKIWRVWPASGAPSVEAHVSGADDVDAHCSGQIALKTDLPKVTMEHPLKFGIAVDSSIVAVSTVEEVRPSDSNWASAERAVLAKFAALERAQANRERQQMPREVPEPVAHIAALYREARSARSLLYFEAEKKYRTPRDPRDEQCTALTVMTGWLVTTDAGAVSLADPKLFLTDCDAKEFRTVLPLAVIRVSGRSFWVLQEHGYEDETYLIGEVRHGHVRYPIEVNGGGC